jgi:hypothetical protein
MMSAYHEFGEKQRELSRELESSVAKHESNPSHTQRFPASSNHETTLPNSKFPPDGPVAV